jgi:hypothetical protein
MKAMRGTVYAAIDGERAYQDSKWPATELGVGPSLIEWLVFIEDYVAEAKRYVSRNTPVASDDFARNALRKVAAMAVAGLEQHGVTTREKEGPRPIGAVAV